MKKHWIIWMVLSVIVYGQNYFEQTLDYNVSNDSKGFNFIILLNQLPSNSVDQPVLNQLKRKKITSEFSSQLNRTIFELYKKNYQILLSTYFHKNLILSPELGPIHQYHQFEIRKSKENLNSDRKIVEATFNAVDKFVTQEKQYRPLCIIIILPPKDKASLEKAPIYSISSFNLKRDFAFVNVYHEIHKRRYLFPSKVIIYENLLSKNAILVNNS
ncbi:MAG: hypothetical protein VW397_05160 [Candidatus Margulisiibacteriota bacterium]